MKVREVVREMFGRNTNRKFAVGSLVKRKQGSEDSLIGIVQDQMLDTNRVSVQWTNAMQQVENVADLEPATHKKEFPLGTKVKAMDSQGHIHWGSISSYSDNNTYSVLKDAGGWIYGVPAFKIRVR